MNICYNACCTPALCSLQELAHQDIIRQLNLEHGKEVTKLRQEFELQVSACSPSNAAAAAAFLLAGDVSPWMRCVAPALPTLPESTTGPSGIFPQLMKSFEGPEGTMIAYLGEVDFQAEFPHEFLIGNSATWLLFEARSCML